MEGVRVCLLEEDSAICIENTKKFNKHLSDLMPKISKLQDMKPPCKH